MDGLFFRHHLFYFDCLWNALCLYIGIRTNQYKYIEFERGRSPWLFDLQNDPTEMRNLMGTPVGDKMLPRLKARLALLLAEP